MIYLKSILKTIKKSNENNVPFIMINAWNEWAEGAYLEPDTMNGYKYLQAIEKVTKKWL